MKKIIDLPEFVGFGLILAMPTGIWFSNQTGGYVCSHPSLEGIFVPLNIDFDTTLFLRAPYAGWCADGITNETADILDAALEPNMLVDRERIHLCQEAWIFVHKIQCFPGFENAYGVLTWNNSD